VYNLLIALALGLPLAIPAGVFFGVWAAILPQVVVSVGAYLWLARRTTQKLQGIIERATTEFQANRIQQGITLLEQGYVLQHWQFLVRSQLDAQIGSIYFMMKKYDKAKPLLENAIRNNPIARGMLACIQFRKHQLDLATGTLEEALKYTKKEALLYGLYAYLLSKANRRDDAIDVLNRGLAKLPDNDGLQQARLSLQNGQKMRTKGFGDGWYQFGLEQPTKASRTQRPLGRSGKVPRGMR